MDENIDRKIIFQGIFFVLGVFLLALNYNLFLLPNNFAFAGMSGFAIIVHKITGFNPTAFIYIANFTLLIISFIFLGWEKTKKTIVGTILYPMMITFTLPIAKLLSKSFTFEEMIITVILTALLYGISNGLIYKSGYTTGGNDVLMQLMNKYFKISESKGLLLVNGIVILGCTLAFSIELGIYSLLIMAISTIFLEKVLYGVSDSKLFYVFTRKPRALKKAILEEFESGFTILPTKGGYSHTRGSLLMVVISNRDYYKFKTKILEIDPSAFFIIDDCYEVNGGVKRSNLPFIE